jgi:hypothetical protein
MIVLWYAYQGIGLMVEDVASMLGYLFELFFCE